MNKTRSLTVLLTLFAPLFASGEPLPEQRVHGELHTTEPMPDGLQPLDEAELARTRGDFANDAAKKPDAPAGGPRQLDDEVRRQQEADRAGQIVELDSRIEETARAIRSANPQQRPELEQRYRNLSTLRQGL